MPSLTIPKPDGKLAFQALQQIRSQGHIFAALETFHQGLGDIFHFDLPGLNMVMMAGPEANRFLLVNERKALRWRTESDPITRLLGHGLLVADGPLHDDSRKVMNPALHRQALERYVAAMWRHTDGVTSRWATTNAPIEMLSEMRRVAILILMDTLFSVEFGSEMERLWHPILRMLDYISPGLWMFFPNMPRPGYRRALREVDDALYHLIRERRAQRAGKSAGPSGEKSADSTDLLALLLNAGMSDQLIRDQILTMFIAGHDTSTALLAWTLYLLSTDTGAMEKARLEVDQVLGDEPPTLAHLSQMRYLGHVIDESLRLYPPAHIGSRVALTDLTFQEHVIPAGTRLMYSIYLTHRDPKHWPNPQDFIPERFAAGAKVGEEGVMKRAYTPYAFLPFGGGPRNCIGAAFGQVEAKVVLARILQRYDLHFTGHRVRPKMAVTLEPSPGVKMRVRRRE